MRRTRTAQSDDRERIYELAPALGVDHMELVRPTEGE